MLDLSGGLGVINSLRWRIAACTEDQKRTVRVSHVKTPYWLQSRVVIGYSDPTCLLLAINSIRLGDRAFAAAGPRLLNDLPAQIRRPDLSLDTFRQKLKTYLFVRGTSAICTQLGAVYKLTYLLTSYTMSCFISISAVYRHAYFTVSCMFWCWVWYGP